MTDPTNDIDALLFLLSDPHHSRYSAALRMLVAELDALKTERRMYWESCDALEKQNDELKQRVTELEAHPPADRDRELRERLVESALRGMGCKWMMTQSEAGVIGRQAVWIVDSALAAMRKGEQP